MKCCDRPQPYPTTTGHKCLSCGTELTPGGEKIDEECVEITLRLRPKQFAVLSHECDFWAETYTDLKMHPSDGAHQEHADKIAILTNVAEQIDSMFQS